MDAATLTQFSVMISNDTIPDMPYPVIEPNIEVTTLIITFLMWSAMFFISIPAAIWDYFWTNYNTQNCQNLFGSEWRAFSHWAATGRNDMLSMFNYERPCYNPTQCGYVPLGREVSNTNNKYYLNYVYDTTKITTDNPFGGQVRTAIPMNGAVWLSNLKDPFPKIIGSDLAAAGWYATDLPMTTINGVQGIEVSLMWDVTRAYCTNFVNCPDPKAMECWLFKDSNEKESWDSDPLNPTPPS